MSEQGSRVRKWRRRVLAATIAPLLALAAAIAVYAPSTLRAVAVLAASVDMYDANVVTALVSYDVRESDAPLVLPMRTLRSRRYAPAGRARAPVTLLLHGVHPRGIDESRLRQFARALATTGLDVHTPQLPELAAFEARPQLVDDIAASAAALQRASQGRKVGAFGISFAGGLLLVAAARPQGEATFDYVVALGAHHDLRRLARYYAGEGLIAPEGARRAPPPHRYAGRILAHAYASELFAVEDADTARQALKLQLTERYAEATRARARLTAPGEQRLRDVLEGPSPELRALLLRASERHAAALGSLSPSGRLARLRVPVFLLHGLDDPIVPSSESEWLARELPPDALRRVLLTPALRHAEGSATPAASDTLRLVAFLGAVFREAGP
jgi:pimeloyl-ACP methyl ester carboxylesterase